MAEQYILNSVQVRENLLVNIAERPLDNTWKVTIDKVGGKKPRQRGLQHIWYKDVVKSGLGGIDEESVINVDAKAKRDIAVPLMKRYPEKYESFLYTLDLIEQRPITDYPSPEFMRNYYHKHCHTEWFNSDEMAEFLTLFCVWALSHGIELSDPIDHKLLTYKRR